MTRVVKSGDRLIDLVQDVYGARDEHLLQLVMQHNPRIKKRDLIRIGDRLLFPLNERQEPRR